MFFCYFVLIQSNQKSRKFKAVSASGPHTLAEFSGLRTLNALHLSGFHALFSLRWKNCGPGHRKPNNHLWLYFGLKLFHVIFPPQQLAPGICKKPLDGRRCICPPGQCLVAREKRNL